MKKVKKLNSKVVIFWEFGTFAETQSKWSETDVARESAQHCWSCRFLFEGFDQFFWSLLQNSYKVSENLSDSSRTFSMLSFHRQIVKNRSKNSLNLKKRKTFYSLLFSKGPFGATKRLWEIQLVWAWSFFLLLLEKICCKF